MKERYIAPRLELLTFGASDIIATSGLNPLARLLLETPMNDLSETATDPNV